MNHRTSCRSLVSFSMSTMLYVYHLYFYKSSFFKYCNNPDILLIYLKNESITTLQHPTNITLFSCFLARFLLIVLYSLFSFAHVVLLVFSLLSCNNRNTCRNRYNYMPFAFWTVYFCYVWFATHLHGCQ